MVLKKSKFGANTGNTLRAEKKIGGIQLQKSAAFLSIEDYTGEDLNIPNPNHTLLKSNVLFSLNKKKGWVLTKELSAEIEALSKQNEGCQEQRKNISGNKVLIVDEYNLCDANCSGVALYMNTSGVKKVSNSHKPNLQIHKDRDGVIYRVQKTDYKHTYPYHTGFCYRESRYLKNSKRNKKGNRGTNKNVETYNYICPHNDLINAEYLDQEAESFQSNFVDFVLTQRKQARKKKKKKKRMLENRQENALHQTNDKRLPSNADNKIIKTNNLQLKKNASEGKSVYTFDCILLSKSTLPYHLQDQFGHLYVEGSSFPRNFMIFKERTPFSPLILVKMKNCKYYYAECSSSSVSVLGMEAINCEHFINQVCSIDEIVHAVFPGITDITKNISRASCKLTINGKCNIFEQYQDTTDSALRIDEFALELIQMNNNSYITDKHIGLPPERFNLENVCGICFESVQALDKIALRQCCHCFCHSCWQSYIHEKLSSEWTGEVLCPESKCEAKVDLVTIASLVNSHDEYINYFRKSIDYYILREPTLKYCPTPNCMNIARIQRKVFNNNTKGKSKVLEKDLAIIHCRNCTRKWCFQCEKPSHWPSTCAATEKYRSNTERIFQHIFDQSGNSYSTTVTGKKCPFCSRFVEKNGGCDMMTCSCMPSAQFCWSCQQPLNVEGYNHFPCTRKQPEEEFVSTSAEFLSNNSTFNQRALESHCSSLQIRRRLTKLRFKHTSTKSHTVLDFSKLQNLDSLTVFAIQAHHYLQECYIFLEMLFAGSAASKKKLSVLIRKMDRMKFFVGLVDNCLDVTDVKDMEINKIQHYMKDINQYVIEILGLNC